VDRDPLDPVLVVEGVQSAQEAIRAGVLDGAEGPHDIKGQGWEVGRHIGADGHREGLCPSEPLYVDPFVLICVWKRFISDWTLGCRIGEWLCSYS
jgi:hypothetical protein